jgi:SAM-dependent methyltransferase
MIARENGEEIEYGVITTEAGDFPIVEGILRLHVDEYREPIVEHVRQNRLSQALNIAFAESPFDGRTGAAINFASRLAFRSGFNIAAERLNRLKRNYARLLTETDDSFAEIVEKLSSGPLADWQIYRFSMPTFLPVFPLLHIVRDDRSILDFGSGSGQASFLISRMWPNSKIVCADYSFYLLYLAKRYFVPDATYVCLNGNYLLPFESRQFSTVFSSDTLHYIDSKLSLTQEFRRIGYENTVLILPHLHNRLACSYAKSLTPKGYRELFRGVETHIMPEEQVIRGYFFEDALDLSRDSIDEELAASEQGLSIVTSADSSVFKRTEGLWNQRIRSFRHPRINPVYRIAGQPRHWELTRRARDRYAETMTHGDMICIPDTCRVSARSVDATGLVELQRTDVAGLALLARSLIVLDLPERFMGRSQVSKPSNKRALVCKEAV